MTIDDARRNGLILAGAWTLIYMLMAVILGGDMFEHGIRAVATGVAAGSVYTYVQRHRD